MKYLTVPAIREHHDHCVPLSMCIAMRIIRWLSNLAAVLGVRHCAKRAPLRLVLYSCCQHLDR